MNTSLARVSIIAGLLVASCASSPARSSVKVPLEIPEPPPRAAIDPVDAVLVGTALTPERPSAAPVSRPSTTTPPPASTASVSPPAVATVPQATLVGPPEPARTVPAPELRAAGAAGRSPTAAQVRDLMVRTKHKLDAIDRRRLNAGKRIDYDSARRFLSQAEGAVKENNLLLAESSVQKAETLADGLK